MTFNNPQDYIIPQSAVNNALYSAQQAETVEKQGAVTSFAKYYDGTGDSRLFVWMAKPIPPVATSMERLGEDFDRNYGINQNLKMLKNWRIRKYGEQKLVNSRKKHSFSSISAIQRSIQDLVSSVRNWCN